MLKNRLSDDWGWATSQLSGESGLIPLNIMEECVRVCMTLCYYLLQCKLVFSQAMNLIMASHGFVTL